MLTLFSKNKVASKWYGTAKNTDYPLGWSVFLVEMDSKGGSWQYACGMLQPPWLFRRKANPSSPCKVGGKS